MTTTPRRRMRQNRVLRLLDHLERDPRADAVIDAAGRGARALPPGRGRDALHGRRLGHPVHPLRVQVPVGSRRSAALLDPRPGRSREAEVLVGVGLAAVPAAPAGWVGRAEHTDNNRETERRPGAAEEGVTHGSPDRHV
ncbi:MULTISPECIES: hypothetical protein [unclassified Streptomyces]|uniref:hypothetical protein n=1 Tax=unclassified Streptomyces TaxID=2593676 RepID=UPI00313DB0FD